MMTSLLHKRLVRLRIPAMLKMRYYKGPYELVNWWEHFVNSIPEGAEFDDLTMTTQNLILEWEREIIKSIPTGSDTAEVDLETSSMMYEWQRNKPS